LSRLSWIRTSSKYEPFEVSYNINRDMNLSHPLAFDFDVDPTRFLLKSGESCWDLPRAPSAIRSIMRKEVYPLLPSFLLLALLTVVTMTFIIDKRSSALIGVSALSLYLAFLLACFRFHLALEPNPFDRHQIFGMWQSLRVSLYANVFIGQTAVLYMSCTVYRSCKFVGLPWAVYALLLYLPLLYWPFWTVFKNL
jgi:hypothetical protein